MSVSCLQEQDSLSAPDERTLNAKLGKIRGISRIDVIAFVNFSQNHVIFPIAFPILWSSLPLTL
jgi:hypothetical protein